MTESNSTRQLKMGVAGGLVKHLGLQMYSGAVPSLAELISNAWDAMATKVELNLPLGRAIEPTDTIEVADNGHGMTWADCLNKYLIIGRNRRKEQGDLSETFGDVPKRRVMSRKGIGKLAGFGIADRVEVRTVRGGEVTHFCLQFSRIEGLAKGLDSYEPEMLADDGKNTGEPSGTRIILSELKIQRAIIEESFRASIARRFTILSDPNFTVHVKGVPVTKQELPFQFRFPPEVNTWEEENVIGGGTVKFWFGFTPTPIKDDLARGVVVHSRGKLAQQAWTFDIPGVGNQAYGLSYLTGEIQADFLDATDGKDLIATDRGSVRWDESPADVLKQWAADKLLKLLKEWVEQRTKKKEERPVVAEYLKRGERLQPRQRELFTRYVKSLTGIPQVDKDAELLDELVKFGYNAMTNQGFLEFVRNLNAAEESTFGQVQSLMTEWSVIEVISAAQLVKGRVEVVKLFERLLDEGAREVPDLHELLKMHPWLIDPTWDKLEDEITIEKCLEKHFKPTEEILPNGKRRLDFFCIGDAGRLFVVEIKRADFRCTDDTEIKQLKDYVDFLRDQEDQHKDLRRSRNNVQGYLIAGDFSTELNREIERISRDGMFVRRWGELLRTAREAHKQYFEIMKKRAPKDDPRVIDLEELDQSITETSES